ncbi:Kinetochore protein fta4 [Ceratocystis lukuohia]|uniref:Kinetochore protein fta4 n=1 Tax=Ceratocystis lukuohia TaxID=2019550 RepID=A0ABR4MHZ2_9PEZI
MAPPTILALKQAFITTQTGLLANDLVPSPAWLEAQATVDDPLPARAVDDALFRLSHTLTQHSRRVHAPQATRHVAEQLDRLYWQATERGADVNTADGDMSNGVGRHVDIKNISTNRSSPPGMTKAISNLPPTWPSETQAHAFPAESQRYTHLVTSLTNLNAQRAAVLARVQRLRRIRASLAPLQPIPSKRARSHSEGPDTDAGPDANADGHVAAQGSEEDGNEAVRNAIQENLVARNGAMEKELERMRVLLARVGGRVSRLKAESDEELVLDLREAEKKKVDALLDTL